MTLLYPPTLNGLQKTLDAELSQGETSSLTLSNTTGVQNKPGIVLINRINANGEEKDTSDREWIIYTGTSGNTLTGLTRAIGGSTDQAHAAGSVVEFVPDVSVFQAILDAITIANNDVFLDEDDMESDSATKGATQQSIKAFVESEIANIPEPVTDGWTTYTAVVPTRASADDPTFVLTFSGVDLTTTIYPGMRIKWTQNSTVRYGIVTKMAFSTDTTMTIYGGTDYNVEDTGTHAISDFYYSTHKAPAGFPLDPTKWTLSNTDTSDRSQSNPTNDTWYNIGTTNNQLVIHTGLWRVYYQVNLNIQNTSDTFVSANVTLSTANNSESDSTMTALTGGGGTSGTIIARNGLYRERILNLSAKATYYLNAKSTSGGTALEFLGSTGGPTIIRAVCAYL